MLNKLLTAVQHTIQQKITASLISSETIEETEAVKLSALFKKHILFSMFTGIKVSSPSILSHHLNPVYSNLFSKVLNSYERTDIQKMECFEDIFSRFIDETLCGSNEKLNQFFYWSKDSWNDIFSRNVKKIDLGYNIKISATGNGIFDLINLFYQCVKAELNDYISHMKEKADMLDSHQAAYQQDLPKDRPILIPQSILNSRKEIVYCNSDGSGERSLSEKQPFRYLLLANGGMGKTTILHHILQNEKGFEGIFMLSLSELLYRAADSPVIAYSSPKSEEGYILREIARKNNIEPEDMKSRRFLLLLDGYNEMFDCDTVKNYSILQGIRKEVEWISDNMREFSVIITSRDIPEYKELEDFERCTITEISSDMVEKLMNRDGMNRLLSTEMQQLLTFPLYYKFFLSMERNVYPQTKYELFEILHKRCYTQIAGEKYFADQDSYFFIYYIIIPHIGKEMEIRRTDVLTKGEIRFIFQSLVKKKNYILHIYNNIFSEHRGGIMIPEAFEAVWEFISRRFDFGRTDMGRCEFRFIHQEFQEYFAAFAIAHDLISIPSAYMELSLNDYDLEFNLKSNVQTMILSFLCRHFSISDKILIYEKLFKVKPKIVLNYSESMEILSVKIENEILLAHYAYLFSYHFFVHSRFFTIADNKIKTSVLERRDYNVKRNLVTRHNIIDFICRFCVEHKNLILSMNFSEKVLASLFDIICGETEYWRRADLTVCREYLLFIKELIRFLPNKERNLMHMKAKALIQNAENIQSGKKLPSYYEGNVSAEELFSEAVILLRQAVKKGYNLSANLLGRLYSEPCFWLKERKLIHNDRAEAFCIMNECLEKMTNSWFFQSGTELVYLARSLIFLIIKGYLQLTPQGKPVYNIFHEPPNKYSLKYVDSVLEKIEGQEYPLISWVKGWRELLKHPYEKLTPEIYKKVAGYFSNEASHLLVDFITAMYLHEPDYVKIVYGKEKTSDEIFDGICNNMKNLKYGSQIQCDQKDPYYVYSDIKSIFLILKNILPDTPEINFRISRMDKILLSVESEKLNFSSEAKYFTC